MLLVGLNEMSDEEIKNTRIGLIEAEQRLRMGSLKTLVDMINDLTLEQHRREHARD